MNRHDAVQQIDVNDSWRGWIAENLILGGHPEALIGIMIQSGIVETSARAEMDAALRSPYLRGVSRLHNRLAKRDWVLRIQQRLNRLGPNEVPRRERLSGAAFLDEHYRRNEPVIITGMLDDCVAREKWTYDYLIGQLGGREVEVQFGREADPNYEMNSNSHKRRMPFGEYVAMVRDSGPTNDFYMTANNDGRNREALQELMADLPPLAEYLEQGRGGFSGSDRPARSRRSITT